MPTSTSASSLLAARRCNSLFRKMPTSNSQSLSTAEAASLQHELIGLYTGGTNLKNTNTHPDAGWFDGAGLGLFIHWGISSTHGAADLSWAMIKDTPWNAGSEISLDVTPREYYALAERFNPQNYHPERWLAAAKAAGATYAVLTAKHHDGYTLWPSASGEIGVQTYLDGRDLVTPFVEACREVGLKVGLYYSPPDWHIARKYMSFEYSSFGPLEDWQRDGGVRPDVQAYDMEHRPYEPTPYPADFEERIAAHVKIQIEELLMGYGKIDVLWFDGRPYPFDTPGAITLKRIRELQPAMLVNPRLLREGDFQTFECRMPTEQPESRWEYNDTISDTRPGNSGWGYHENGVYASAEVVLEKLERIQRWGGNYLANCGLGPDGDMPPGYYELMKSLQGRVNSPTKE
jgi:alpha-L-fucosidase